MKEATKKRIMEKRRRTLKSLGIEVAKTPEENRRRIREAHIGPDK